MQDRKESIGSDVSSQCECEWGNKESISRVAVESNKAGYLNAKTQQRRRFTSMPPTGTKARDRIDDWTRFDSSRKIPWIGDILATLEQ
jgi:hypothetical protein